MTDYPPQGQVTDADVRAAQTLLDGWFQESGAMVDDKGVLRMRHEDGLLLRGMVAAWSAEVRAAGYTEGFLRGRRDVAGWVRDCLAGEGL